MVLDCDYCCSAVSLGVLWSAASICREKESRLQCVMQLFGLQQMPAVLGWLTAQTLVYIPLAFVLSLQLKLGACQPIHSDCLQVTAVSGSVCASGAVFPNADWGELFLFLSLFNCAMLSSCRAMSTLFQYSKTASWVSVLLFVAAYMVFLQVLYKRGRR